MVVTTILNFSYCFCNHNILLGFQLYLEDSSEGLPGQLVVDDGEEFAERAQEGRGLHTLSQQVLYGGQDVNFCLLKQTLSGVSNW